MTHEVYSELFNEIEVDAMRKMTERLNSILDIGTEQIIHSAMQ